MKKYLLALDASSSIIGYSIFDIDTKELIEINHYVHDKSTSLIERVIEYEKILNRLQSTYNITDMVIEESFQGFFGGGSSANTIAVLTAINFGYQLVTFKAGVKVNTITVGEARKGTFPGIKIRTLAKMQGIKEKDFCFQLTEAFLKPHFTTKIISKGARKGLVVYEDYCKDMADSWITGMGFLNKK